MAWKESLSNFFRKYGPASKMVAVTVLNFTLPGSAAIINLVENAFDTAEKVAENDWEDRLRKAAECNVAELDRLGQLIEILQGELSSFCDVAHSLKDQPGKIDALLKRMLKQDAKLQESVMLLRGIGKQFERVHQKLDATHEVVSQIHGKLEQFLQSNRIATSVKDPLHISVTNERERELILGYRSQLRDLPIELVRADDWLMLGDGLAATGSFAEAQESHALAAVEARSHADLAKEAEAHFKAYRSSCELRRWNEALESLNAAIALHPTQYRLFDPRYEPITILGAGGFGTVFHCRDLYGRTDVAIKTLHVADLDRNLDEIFAEAHTLRQLDHPGIIRAYDHSFADTSKQERPYFVLEYFPGETLEAVIKRLGSLSLKDMLSIAVQIADAVDAAHKQGILHRDLKPGNVMIAKNKKEWAVKVIDFGLAVRTKVATTASLQLSAYQGTVRDASFTGTLEYASPEQRGKLPGIKVGPRSDIFSLGKTCLYILFNTLEVKSKHWAMLPEPHRDVAQTLLEKATDEDIQDRPRSMKELRDSLMELREQLTITRPQPSPSPKPPRVVAKPIPKKRPQAQYNFEDARRFALRNWKWGILPAIGSIVLLFVAVSLFYSRVLPQVGKGVKDSAVGNSVEVTTYVGRLEGHTNPVTCVAYSPDGTRLVSGSYDCSIRIWDANNGKALKTYTGHGGIVRSVVYSPDGRKIASGGSDKLVQIWDSSNGQILQTLGDKFAPVFGVAFSPNGTQIAVGSMEPIIRIVDVRSGQNVGRLQGAAPMTSVAYKPDGTQIASGSLDMKVHLWDTILSQSQSGFATLGPALSGHTASVTSVAYSPDGTRIASGSIDNTIRIWDSSNGQRVQSLQGHSAAVTSVAFSPDGKRIVSGSKDSTVRVWNAVTGQVLRTFDGHTGPVEGVTFSPDGNRVASGSADKTVHIWDVSDLTGTK